MNSTYKEDLQRLVAYIKTGDQKINQNKLAASFQDRSDLLTKTCKIWLKGIIAIMLIIMGLALISSYNHPDFSSIDRDRLNIYIRGYIFNLPICIALFWGLWFCCKQYSYSCRLRDDYHYKYDLSTAFYGYNEEIKKLSDDDKNLRLTLLDIVLKNIGKNPVENRVSECNSPYAEMIDKLKEPISMAQNLVQNLKGTKSE